MLIALPVNVKTNIMNFLRREGYAVYENKISGQINFQKRISRELYPRFHIYITSRGEKEYLHLHLDQKKPTYEIGRAHSGEYDSEIVQNEGERLKISLKNQYGQK